MNENALSKVILDSAFEVHRALGPRLLESVYAECMCRELSSKNIPFKRQVSFPILYKNVKLESNLRIDLLVGDIVVVEIKSVESILPIHKAQLLTYLKLTGKKLGLLINFNEEHLKTGIRRVINGYIEPDI